MADDTVTSQVLGHRRDGIRIGNIKRNRNGILDHKESTSITCRNFILHNF